MIVPYAPRLTIGIPTCNRRPARLVKAIQCALGQSIPVRILIADQNGEAEETLRPFAEHYHLRRVVSEAKSLWDNWRACVDYCDTELFAWLQDDDVIAPHYAKRIVSAFDAYPTARFWMARLGVANLEGLGCWWMSPGPMVPMDLLYGQPSLIRANLLPPAAYVTAFSMSPAVAFRCDLDAMNAVARCPREGADLYNERIVLAELARLGPGICDPAFVGYWVHHEANESKAQNANNGAAVQYGKMVEHIEPMLSEPFCNGWQETFKGWCLNVGINHLTHWMNETRQHRDKSERLCEIHGIMLEALQLLGFPVEQAYKFDEPKPEPEQKPEPCKAVDTRHRRARKAVTR